MKSKLSKESAIFTNPRLFMEGNWKKYWVTDGFTEFLSDTFVEKKAGNRLIGNYQKLGIPIGDYLIQQSDSTTFIRSKGMEQEMTQYHSKPVRGKHHVIFKARGHGTDWNVNLDNDLRKFLENTNENPMETLVEVTLWTLAYIIYVDIETKIIKPKQFVKCGKSKKLKNDSKTDFHLLTPSWHVESVRDTPFAVSGHWRLQPYGPRDNPRFKQIRIEPYQKKGYVRKAKKP